MAGQRQAMSAGGMMKQSRLPLVFSHANGFPAPSYAKLFAALEDDFEIRYLPRLGHDPDYPVTDGWSGMRNELINFIERGPHPVVGVGHSLGGLLSFMAAVARPDLFSALVLLDSPIFAPLLASGLAISKHLGFIDRLTPARATLGRRQHWANKAEALAHFSKRLPFRDFAPECLADYVQHGTIEDADAGGLVLWFDPRIESRIYSTMPHYLHRLMKRLQVPAGFIYGRASNSSRLSITAALRRRFLPKQIEGSHLFPLEHPQETARAIRAMAETLLTNDAHR